MQGSYKITETGKVVYKRKTHYYTARDIERIIKSVFPRWGGGDVPDFREVDLINIIKLCFKLYHKHHRVDKEMEKLEQIRKFSEKYADFWGEVFGKPMEIVLKKLFELDYEMMKKRLSNTWFVGGGQKVDPDPGGGQIAPDI